MCKFCRLKKERNTAVDEKTNGLKCLTAIDDGSQTFGLYLNRYVNVSENYYEASLDIDWSIMLNGRLCSVKTKQVDIRYCPFCGEEL